MIGASYSFNETFYSYGSSKRTTKPGTQYEYVREEGTGSCALKNHRFKFIFGIHFSTQFGFKFYIQPLNPELRIIGGNSKISKNVYEGFSFKRPQGYYGAPSDSTSTLIKTESRVFDFNGTGPVATIAFPTTIGFEQNIRLKKQLFVVGINSSFSAIEKYIVARFYIGIHIGMPPEKPSPAPEK
ncbi:MAG: hypothetical protein H0W61_05075 [Bacteroidetes bacterium]|nr:hypothetical protein [Bacteroidota bacterium]